MVKNLTASAGDAGDSGSISRLGGASGVEIGNPLQYSCRKIPWKVEPGGLQPMGFAKELDMTEHAPSKIIFFGD